MMFRTVPRRLPPARRGTGSPAAHGGNAKTPGIPGVFSVGDTGIEPVTSSVSGKRATAAPIARVVLRSGPGVEVATGFEPV